MRALQPLGSLSLTAVYPSKHRMHPSDHRSFLATGIPNCRDGYLVALSCTRSSLGFHGLAPRSRRHFGVFARRAAAVCITLLDYPSCYPVVQYRIEVAPAAKNSRRLLPAQNIVPVEMLSYNASFDIR